MNPRENLTKVKKVVSLTDDLFGAINFDFSELSISKETFNLSFQVRFSERWCSPLLELFIQKDNDGEKYISSDDFLVIGSFINDKYKHKWNRMVNIAKLEYDPIHNYSDVMSESITDNDDTTKNDSGSVNEDNSFSKNEQRTNTGNEENSIYGFNSSSAVPSKESEASLTYGSNISVSEDKDKTISNETTSERDYTRSRSVSHSGNIGNLSYQNLINQEIELWKWSIVDQVVSDVADVLTLNIY